MSNKTTVNGEEYYCQAFADVESLNVIFNNGTSTSKTDDIEGIDADAYFTYDGGTGYKDITGEISLDPTNVTVKADKASGTYFKSVDVTLKASKNDAVIVYTTNGSEPTASSDKATGSKSFTFTQTTTLKAGALVDGVVKNVISNTYTITNEQPNDVTLYYDNANNWSNVYCYAYVNNDGVVKNAEWPGKEMTYDATLTINGKTGWWVYTMPDNLKEAQIVVNNRGNGAQYPGANVPGVFMEGKSKVLTGTTLSDYIPTGIGSVVTTPITNVFRVYTLDGRAINGVKSTTDLRKGVYIVNGRKLVVR